MPNEALTNPHLTGTDGQLNHQIIFCTLNQRNCAKLKWEGSPMENRHERQRENTKAKLFVTHKKIISKHIIEYDFSNKILCKPKGKWRSIYENKRHGRHRKNHGNKSWTLVLGQWRVYFSLPNSFSLFACWFQPGFISRVTVSFSQNKLAPTELMSLKIN